MFATLSVLCVATKINDKEATKTNNKKELRPIHVASIFLDLITSLALLTIASLIITGIIPATPTVTYVTLALGAAFLSPYLFIAIGAIKYCIVKDKFLC